MRPKMLRVLPVALAVSVSASALADSQVARGEVAALRPPVLTPQQSGTLNRLQAVESAALLRSEEHTSELQSLTNLVCRLLLEKKKKKKKITLHAEHTKT